MRALEANYRRIWRGIPSKGRQAKMVDMDTYAGANSRLGPTSRHGRSGQVALPLFPDSSSGTATPTVELYVIRDSDDTYYLSAVRPCMASRRPGIRRVMTRVPLGTDGPVAVGSGSLPHRAWSRPPETKRGVQTFYYILLLLLLLLYYYY